jgi:beta-glucanase (GH16 family)
VGDPDKPRHHLTKLLPVICLTACLPGSGWAKDTGQGTAPQPRPLYDSGDVAWAVNLGGKGHTGIDGVQFEADDLGVQGVRGRMDRVLGTQDQTTYRTFREGELKLQHQLPDGHYDITFLFAEPRSTNAGARVFDVQVQGERVIEGLNIRQIRGGRYQSALARTVTGVRVTDGQLDISLVARQGQPLLNAVVVRGRLIDARQWQLQWNDEFDYTGTPDAKRWNIEVWDARRVNDEDQAYTDRRKNLRVGDGILTVEAHREEFGEARYTSGRLHSRGKGELLYGRADIRARLPGGQGTWSALWMLPSDPFRYASLCSSDDEWQGRPDCDAWPNSGEIDIMEHVGYDSHRVHGTVHNKAYYAANWQQRQGAVEVRDVYDSFHVYSLVWQPDYLQVFFDGSLYFTYYRDGQDWRGWPYDHPYHVILNLAIGGDWGRAGGPIDDTIFPVALEVDYVRLYKLSPPELASATPVRAR